MAFDEYCCSTSKLRVASVCLLTPLPAVVVVILMELPPLKPLEAGCLANYIFWLRHWVAVGVILWAGILQAKQLIQELPISNLRMFTMSFMCSGVYVALNIVVAYFWVFPIPFLAVLGGIIMFPIWIVGIVAAVGYKTLVDIPDIRERLQRFFDLEGAVSTLMILYPANNAAFQAVPITFRSLYTIVLPVINLAMKNMIVAKGTHLEDGLPETIVFAVDIFSALYSIFCMRSANTFSSVMTIVAIDAMIIGLTAYGMHRRMSFARELTALTPSPLPGRVMPAWSNITSSSTARAPPTQGLTLDQSAPPLLVVILEMLEHPGQVDPAHIRDFRLFSTIPQVLSPLAKDRLSTLAKLGIYNNDRIQPKTRSLAEVKERYSSASSQKMHRMREIHDVWIQLKSDLWIASTNSRNSTVLSQPEIPGTHFERRQSAIKAAVLLVRKKNSAIVHEVLQLLFSSEHLVLIAYVQCIIPPMFVIYISALHDLPNLNFYPHAAELTTDDQLNQRLATISLYWGLKMLQLVVVHWLMTSRFTIAAMYQIAFVLESHALLVQCKLVFPLIFAVQSSVVHYGGGIHAILAV
jgi:hypothetical protein